MNDVQVRLAFAMRYPSDHEDPELRGQVIERQAKCSRCDRPFTQTRLDRSFLNSLKHRSEEQLRKFLSTCEVIAVAGERQAWFPDRCAHCTRAQMNANSEGANAQQQLL